MTAAQDEGNELRRWNKGQNVSLGNCLLQGKSTCLHDYGM